MAALCCMVHPLSADQFGCYTYLDNGPGMTITEYTCTEVGPLVIPNTINGKPVTAIGDGAFSDLSDLTSVTIPASVTSIGNGAFIYCTSLTSIEVEAANLYFSSEAGVLFNKLKNLLIQYPGGNGQEYSIPHGVTTIGDDAFAEGPGPTSVTIPSTVTSIGTSAFADCGRLTSITVDAANPSFSSADGVLFDEQKSLLIQYPAGKGVAYLIPAGVASIGDEAFYGCTRLQRVTIPASVSNIGDDAFGECSGLTSASFAGNAPLMGNEVFGFTASGFKVYYFNDKTGFTSPWNVYPSVNMGDSSPVATWLISNGLPYDADPQSDPNRDGVNLLMAYGLSLDPNLNLAGSMPQAVIGGGELSLTFDARAAGVSYAVETSVDARAWTTVGVFIAAPDSDGCRTASIPMNAPRRFLRLVVTTS